MGANQTIPDSKSQFADERIKCFSGTDYYVDYIDIQLRSAKSLKGEELELATNQNCKWNIFADDFVRTRITDLSTDKEINRQADVAVNHELLLTIPEQSRILILGEPGSGKSSFLAHLCHKWSKGSLWNAVTHIWKIDLKTFSSWLLLKQKDNVWRSKPTSLRFAEFIYEREKIKRSDGTLNYTAEHISQRISTSNDVFVLDGIDEVFQTEDVNYDEVSQFLGVFKRFILSSRYTAAIKIAELGRKIQFDNILHVIGFNPNSSMDYIRSYFNNNSSQYSRFSGVNSRNFCEFLAVNNWIAEIFRIPLLLELFCYAWCEQIREQSCTITLLFSEVESLLQTRYNGEAVSTLRRIAFHSLKNNEVQGISKSTIKGVLGENSIILREILEYGFIHPVRYLNTTPEFYFYHTSLQSFLASSCVFQWFYENQPLKDIKMEDVKNFISKYCKIPASLELTFLSGLLFKAFLEDQQRRPYVNSFLSRILRWKATEDAQQNTQLSVLMLLYSQLPLSKQKSDLIFSKNPLVKEYFDEVKNYLSSNALTFIHLFEETNFNPANILESLKNQLPANGKDIVSSIESLSYAKAISLLSRVNHLHFEKQEDSYKSLSSIHSNMAKSYPTESSNRLFPQLIEQWLRFLAKSDFVDCHYALRNANSSDVLEGSLALELMLKVYDNENLFTNSGLRTFVYIRRSSNLCKCQFCLDSLMQAQLYSIPNSRNELFLNYINCVQILNYFHLIISTSSLPEGSEIWIEIVQILSECVDTFITECTKEIVCSYQTNTRFYEILFSSPILKKYFNSMTGNKTELKIDVNSTIYSEATLLERIKNLQKFLLQPENIEEKHGCLDKIILYVICALAANYFDTAVHNAAQEILEQYKKSIPNISFLIKLAGFFRVDFLNSFIIKEFKEFSLSKILKFVSEEIDYPNFINLILLRRSIYIKIMNDISDTEKYFVTFAYFSHLTEDINRFRSFWPLPSTIQFSFSVQDAILNLLFDCLSEVNWYQFDETMENVFGGISSLPIDSSAKNGNCQVVVKTVSFLFRLYRRLEKELKAKHLLTFTNTLKGIYLWSNNGEAFQRTFDQDTIDSIWQFIANLAQNLPLQLLQIEIIHIIIIISRKAREVFLLPTILDSIRTYVNQNPPEYQIFVQKECAALVDSICNLFVSEFKSIESGRLQLFFLYELGILFNVIDEPLVKKLASNVQMLYSISKETQDTFVRSNAMLAITPMNNLNAVFHLPPLIVDCFRPLWNLNDLEEIENAMNVWNQTSSKDTIYSPLYTILCRIFNTMPLFHECINNGLRPFWDSAIPRPVSESSRSILTGLIPSAAQVKRDVNEFLICFLIHCVELYTSNECLVQIAAEDNTFEEKFFSLLLFDFNSFSSSNMEKLNIIINLHLDYVLSLVSNPFQRAFLFDTRTMYINKVSNWILQTLLVIQKRRKGKLLVGCQDLKIIYYFVCIIPLLPENIPRDSLLNHTFFSSPVSSLQKILKGLLQLQIEFEKESMIKFLSLFSSSKGFCFTASELSLLVKILLFYLKDNSTDQMKELFTIWIANADANHETLHIPMSTLRRFLLEQKLRMSAVGYITLVKNVLPLLCSFIEFAIVQDIICELFQELSSTREEKQSLFDIFLHSIDASSIPKCYYWLQLYEKLELSFRDEFQIPIDFIAAFVMKLEAAYFEKKFNSWLTAGTDFIRFLLRMIKSFPDIVLNSKFQLINLLVLVNFIRTKPIFFYRPSPFSAEEIEEEYSDVVEYFKICKIKILYRYIPPVDNTPPLKCSIPYFYNCKELRSLLEQEEIFFAFSSIILHFDWSEVFDQLSEHLLSDNTLIVDRTIRIFRHFLILDTNEKKFEKMLVACLDRITIDISSVLKLNKALQNLPKEIATPFISFLSEKQNILERNLPPWTPIYLTPLFPSNKRYHCFLSHDWGVDGINHRKIQRIYQYLATQGILCWIDTEEIRTNISQPISQGIEESMFGIIFLTQNYQSKVLSMNQEDWCLREFDKLARTHENYRIPVKMESDFLPEPTTVIKAFQNDNLYVDMSNIEFTILEEGNIDNPAFQEENKKFQMACNQLIEKIQFLVDRLESNLGNII